ncbi:DinB family protein [Paenibacillus sp. YSY-4.3]
MSGQIVQGYDYNIWANERMIQHLRALPEELFLREVNLGFKSIAEVFGHLASADEVWFARIKEENPPSTAAKSFITIEEASNHITGLQSRIRQHLGSISNFEKNVAYRNTRGQEFQNSISEIIQHVVNHGTYHRGNVTTILRYLGHSGTTTDYISFLRKDD